MKRTLTVLLIISISSYVNAVTSNMTEFTSGSDFAKGDPNGVVIDSSGKITLNRDYKIIAEKFDNLWTINSIIEIGENIFIGTSPDGAILKISGTDKEKIYSGNVSKEKEASTQTKESNQIPEEKCEKSATESSQFSNEHIFAMCVDSQKRLVAGISGEDCRIIKFSPDMKSYETICKLKDDSFIFSLIADSNDNIYIASGPNGKIYKIKSGSSEPVNLYELNERNITSLKLVGDILYAGSDKRGIVYKLKSDGSETNVLYDSDQTDIISILPDSKGNLYVVATGTDNSSNGMGNMPPMNMQAMQPEQQDNDASDDEEGNRFSTSQGGLRMTIAATKPQEKDQRPEMYNGQQQNAAESVVYKISPNGIKSKVMQSRGLFLDANLSDNEIFVATGNNGKLLSVNTESLFQSSIYEDSKSSQLTSLLKSDKGLLLGLSNPARLVLLSQGYAETGNWVSEIIDAGQPALWGKLQLDAQIPEGCSIKLSSRSGNISDSENGDMSQWSKPIEVEEATALDCPTARFAQIKIILDSNSGKDKSPVIRGVALANVIPNIAPVIKGIKTARSPQEGAKGIINIGVSASDENDDPLLCSYYIRNIESSLWIEIDKDNEQNKYQWNTLSVPDGIYEIKAVVSDKNGNNPQSSLEASWVSNPVAVDNTAPEMISSNVTVENSSATILLTLKDQYSLIDTLRYTVDSKDKWTTTIPDDMLYDTKQESFTIVADELEPGPHIIAVEISDSLGNKTYESFAVELEK